MKIELLKLVEVLKAKGYVVYTQPFKLNIIGIRNSNVESNSFDDLFAVFYTNENNQVAFHLYPGTTDPGKLPLEKPKNPKGTGILAPGQYVDTFKIDLHKGKYPALCQRLGKVKVYRDNNKDDVLDFNPANLEEGYFGCNIHHAGVDSKRVDYWSEMCQVFKKIADHFELMGLANRQAHLYGNIFTYTLIESKELEDRSQEPEENSKIKMDNSKSKIKNSKFSKGESEDGKPD